MARLERDISASQTEKLLKSVVIADALIGVGLILIPGLGAVGAVALITGLGGYAFLERQKNKKQI